MPCRRPSPNLTQNGGIVGVTGGQGWAKVPFNPPRVVRHTVSWAKIDRHVRKGPSRDMSSSKSWRQLHAETGMWQAVWRLSNWAVMKDKFSVATQAIAITVEDRTVLWC